MKILWSTVGWWLLLLPSQIQLRGANGGNIVTLTNASELHHLSRPELALAYPVRLRGVVTYSDPQWGLLFIRDAYAGAFVALAGGTYPTNTELVEIVGRVEEGSFLPLVAGASWRHLGTGAVPDARRINQPELFASEIDCEWSELVGVVRQITLNDAKDHFQIDVTDRGWRARLFLPTPAGGDLTVLNQLIDARVSALGVAGVDYDGIRGITGFKSFVPSRACLQVIDQPPSDPFLLSCLPLAKVRAFSGTNTPLHRVHVRGIATYLHPPSELVLQEEESAVRVSGAGPNQFKVGDSLEAVGFIGSGVFSPILENAVIRPATAKLQVEPVSVAPATVLWGDYDARLIRVTAILQNQVFTATNQTLTLLQNGILFGVSIQSPKPAGDGTHLQKGDRVRVTGVCIIQGDQRGAPQSFQVMLGSVSDVVLLPRVHVFSAQQVLVIVGLAAAAWGLALFWGMALRRRVRQQTEIIRVRLEKEIAMEKRYQHLLENAAFPVLIFHRDSLSILYVNQRAAVRLYGAATIHSFSLASECCDDTETLQVVLQDLQRLGQLTGFEMCLKTAEEQRFWALVCANCIEFDQQPAVFLSFSDITERKQAEQAMRESHQRLTVMFEGARDAIFLADITTGVILDANDEAARLLRRPKQEIIGLHQTQIHSPEKAEEYRHLFAMRALSPRSIPLEAEVLTSDGQRVAVEISSSIVTLAGGRRALQGIFHDITERKQAEEQIKMLKHSIDAHCDGAYWMDSDNRFVYVNDAGCKALGYTREELIGTTVSAVNLEATPERLNQVWERLRRQGFFTGESVHRRKDRSEFPIEIVSTYFRFGGREYNCGFARDITERKRAEEQIRKLSQAVEQSPMSIVITDLNGDIQYVNPKFTQVSGYTVEEARGQNPRILQSGQISSENYLDMWKAITSGREWRGEFHNKKKNGELYWEDASISPIRDAKGVITHFLAVKEDITQRKRAEAEKVKLEAQLLQAQKMESVGQLAGGVAHDFNNMLAATMMHLGFLQEHEDFGQETQQTLNELMQEAKRAANLTRQLLMFSRRSVLDVKLLDLNELVANLLKMLERLIGEHVTVQFNRREALPAVAADAGMIEQVLMNLSVNARDAMPKGGTLRISIESIQVRAARVRENIEVLPGPFVCLAVADTGCGMDEVTRQHIFEPFFTTKEPGKGTGLGLATVHGIVAQHKGWVEVESEVGKGTTFRVFLPAATKRISEPTQTAKMAAMRGHETILLVEDEEGVRRLAALSLRRLGYAVFEAENGREAMKLWQERLGQIDLLFSDMVMPEGLTGLDLAERLKKEEPNLKVIISSGYSAEISGHAGSAVDGIRYLQKPYQLEVLSKTVRDCLDGKVAGPWGQPLS